MPAGAPRTRDQLLREHERFVELLVGLGVEVVLAEAPDGMVDACFAYDPVFVTGAGAIELRAAKPARRDEPGVPDRRGREGRACRSSAG